MKKITFLGLVAALAISVEGCSFISEFFNSDRQETAKPTIPSKFRVNAGKNESETTKKLEEEEDVVPTPQRVSGLIPATNPDVRASGSIRGRQDPFAPVAVQPRIEKRDTVQGNGEARPPRSRPTIRTTPTIDSLTDQANNSEFQQLLAEEVLITGIVEVGGSTKVIVKAPEESDSRYVEIGQYLSNQQILVKRIEGINSPTPQVVLEQRGIEIKKEVGEKPTEEESTTTAQIIN